MRKAFVTTHCPRLEVNRKRKKKGNICTLSHGYVKNDCACARLLHPCICNKVFSTVGGGKQKEKCLCSFPLLSVRWSTGYAFIWFIEQTYSAGDVPQKHTDNTQLKWNQTHTERNYMKALILPPPPNVLNIIRLSGDWGWQPREKGLKHLLSYCLPV